MRSIPDPASIQGGLVLSPERLDDWTAGVLRNRDRLLRGAYFGIPTEEIRMGLGVSTDRPVVVSGHQPVMMHPGLYAKPLTASVVAARIGGLALHKVTDTDVPREWAFRFPGPSGVERTNPFFDASRQDVPYADQPVPSEDGIATLLDRCSQQSTATIRKTLQGWREPFLAALRSSRQWVEFHEKTLGLLDAVTGLDRSRLVSSAIFATPVFLRYAAAWLRSLDSLGAAYNGALDLYRRELSLRNAAEPSPDLRTEGEWREAPFWLALPGSPRESLWMKRMGPEEVLLKGGVSGREWKASWPGGVLKVEGEVRVWPKALPQSLFVRLFLGDLFIHGTGGGRYERVNDLFFRAVFGEEPPLYGVVSATFRIDEAERTEASKGLERQEHRLRWKRIFQQNPEYTVTRTGEWGQELDADLAENLRKWVAESGFQKLVRDKEVCLERLKDPQARSEAGRAIREINRAMQDFLGPLLNVDFNAYESIRDAYQLLAESYGWREYPFFLHDPGSFLDLRKRIETGI